MQESSLKEKIRSHFVKAPFAEKVDLKGKTIIVTGCSLDSLGYATAKNLAEWGATVIITTRIQPEIVVAALKAELPESTSVDGHELDLTNADSVKDFVQWYKKSYGDKLDVLVNNAGIHLDLLSQWKEPHLSEDGFEIQWRTNYLGTMHLTHLLLPLLQKTAKTINGNAGDARIVNVVSQLHNKGFNAGLFAQYPYNSWVAYGMSKLALVHATFELQRRYSADNVQAYCLHPGAVFTNVADKGLAGNEFLQSVRNMLAPVEQFFMKTREEGAQTTIYCATQPTLLGGQYFQNCRVRPASLETTDTSIAKKLWKETADWTNAHR